MNDAKLLTLAQLRGFLAGTVDLGLAAAADTAARYGLIKTVLTQAVQVRVAVQGPSGSDPTHLQRVSGYSRPQLTRLIARYLGSGRLRRRYRASPTEYTRRFTPEDVVLLAELDSLHGTLSGRATRVLPERAAGLFGQSAPARLATISISHLHNLRAKRLYKQRRVHYSKTQTRPSNIGVRRTPTPEGCPGFTWLSKSASNSCDNGREQASRGRSDESLSAVPIAMSAIGRYLPQAPWGPKVSTGRVVRIGRPAGFRLKPLLKRLDRGNDDRQLLADSTHSSF